MPYQHWPCCLWLCTLRIGPHKKTIGLPPRDVTTVLLWLKTMRLPPPPLWRASDYETALDRIEYGVDPLPALDDPVTAPFFYAMVSTDNLWPLLDGSRPQEERLCDFCRLVRVASRLFCEHYGATGGPDRRHAAEAGQLLRFLLEAAVVGIRLADVRLASVHAEDVRSVRRCRALRSRLAGIAVRAGWSVVSPHVFAPELRRQIVVGVNDSFADIKQALSDRQLTSLSRAVALAQHDGALAGGALQSLRSRMRIELGRRRLPVDGGRRAV
ncbi:hypothetical protein OOT46_28490 [Aquabacterium sp. A7-Y]|uniref:hypothetical protein n=1 Tax=Aquabacterium sp. A7-Y TaxID=1349605 RepID=UPI00223D2F04|nr:hypothetical protein [Aquabacterium sp. A7-Y]MCW7541741.1 hypothetical protein [Aquabacterium sp. A7-Y]